MDPLQRSGKGYDGSRGKAQTLGEVVAERIGVGRLKRADPEFVRRHTGQVIGGVSPLDHPAPVRTWIDPWLREHPVVWAAAGHPAAVFSTTYDELVEMTCAVEVEVGPAD